MIFRTVLLFLLSCALGQADRFVIPTTGLQSAQQPRVTVSPSGRTYVVYGEKESGKIYLSTAVRFTNFSKPKLVGTLPKLALGMKRGPRITVSGKGVFVAAISHENGNLYGWNSGKMTWINDQTGSAKEGLFDIASNKEGVTFAVWLDLRNKGMELWGALSKDGGRSWGTNFQIYASPDGHICECCHPTALVQPDGTLVAMWRNWKDGARDMYIASSKDGYRAQKLGKGTWKLNACPMDGGDITTTPTGDLISVWRRENAIYLSREDEVETMIAPSGRVPVIQFLNEPYIVWQDAGKLWSKSGSNPDKLLAENGGYASVSRFLDNIIVVWEGMNGLEGELIKAR